MCDEASLERGSMKLCLPLALLFCLSMAVAMDIGAGIILGEPTGISVKGTLSENSAWDAAVAWSFSGDEDAVHLHADYLFTIDEVDSWDNGSVPLYIGIGGRTILREKTILGVRVPVGVCWVFFNAPIDCFLEAAPVMDIVPDTEFDFTGGAGIRYWF